MQQIGGNLSASNENTHINTLLQFILGYLTALYQLQIIYSIEWNGNVITR